MRPKSYPVVLSPAERTTLLTLSQSYRHSERERQHARILLMADEAQDAGATPDAAIAAHLQVCLPTVGRVRQRFVQRGWQTAVHRQEQPRRKERVLDGQAEAHLVALTCSAPPEGHKRWSLYLLKDTLIEQQIIDTISHETVRQTLKKINSSPG
jgi:hypothetical protein